MQDAVCREIALAQQLFLLQTRDAPGDKAALKAALLADVFSNGASRLVACARLPRLRSARFFVAPPQISRRCMCTAASAWDGASTRRSLRPCRRATLKP